MAMMIMPMAPPMKTTLMPTHRPMPMMTTVTTAMT